MSGLQPEPNFILVSLTVAPFGKYVQKLKTAFSKLPACPLCWFWMRYLDWSLGALGAHARILKTSNWYLLVFPHADWNSLLLKWEQIPAECFTRLLGVCQGERQHWWIMGWIWTWGIGARGRLKEKTGEVLLGWQSWLPVHQSTSPHPQHVAHKPQCPLQLKPTHVKLYWL